MSATQSARFGRSPSSSSYQNQTQLSSDLGWDAVRKELKEIDHGQAALDSSDVERASRSTTITHSHWKPQDQVSICSNSACKKKFGALDRKLHCRRYVSDTSGLSILHVHESIALSDIRT